MTWVANIPPPSTLTEIPHAELLQRQTTFHHRRSQKRDPLLALGVTYEQRRLGLVGHWPTVALGYRRPVGLRRPRRGRRDGRS